MDIDEVIDCVELMRGAPPEFIATLGAAVFKVVEDYEDWISEGRPELTKLWEIVQFARKSKGSQPDPLQKNLRKWLMRDGVVRKGRWKT